jgi:TolA-binding protein
MRNDQRDGVLRGSLRADTMPGCVQKPAGILGRRLMAGRKFVRSDRWIRGACFGLLALIGSLLGGSTLLADEGLDTFLAAKGLYQKERWSLAEDAFAKFLEKYPQHEQVPLGTYYLGLTQLQREKFDAARTTLRDFVQKFPKSSEVAHADYRIAECSYQLGDLEPAVNDFLQALAKHQTDPFREFAWAYLGDAQRRLGKNESAVSSLKKSLELFPKGRMAVEARFGLAQAYEALDDVDNAVATYREVAADKAGARADAAQFALGNLLFAKQKYAESIAEYKRVESDFPTSKLVSVARLNGGFAQYQLGNFAEALPLFQQAEVDAQQAVTAGYWRGLTLKALGKYADAADALNEVAERAKEHPLAESVVFQLAACQRRAGNLDQAERRFLEVADRWPQGQFADQSLYFAADSMLLSAEASKDEAVRKQKLQATELVLDRFDREFATSGIRFAQKLQRARFLEIRAADGDVSRATELYRSVLAESQNAQTTADARLQLARVLQSQGDNAGALVAIEPLATELLKTPQPGNGDALLMFAHLSLEAGQLDQATQAAAGFLKNNPQDERADQGLSLLAIAQARGAKWADVETSVGKLASEHASSPVVSRTLQTVAESAFAAKEWDQAIRFFQTLAASGVESPFHAAALSGQAWAEYRKGDFANANTHFQQVVTQHPKDDLAAEAAFMAGDSLQHGGKAAEAIAAFEAAFQNYQPSRNAFLAGLQVARLQTQAVAIEKADAAYLAVADAYATVAEHDQVLNEWALVLYEAEQYAKADEIFRRLVKEHPDSKHASAARYSLAESDLINGKLDAAKTAFAELTSDAKAAADVQEDALYRLVGIAVESEAWQDVVDRSNELTKRFPESRYLTEAKFRLADGELRLGRSELAEQLLSDLIGQAQNPEVAETEWFPHAWPLLAEAQFRQKKYEDVLKTSDRLRALDAKSPVQHQVDEVVGRAWKQQARFDKARDAFQSVIRSEFGTRTETAAKAQFMIAETWLLEKKLDKALEEYLKVDSLYSFPEWQSAALLQAGKCDEQLGNKPAAAKSYQLLLQKFPNSEFAADAGKRLKALTGK